MKMSLATKCALATAVAALGCGGSSTTSTELTKPTAETPTTPTAPPINPFLIANSVYPMVHSNSAATDTTSVPGWTGDHTLSEADVQWVPQPPANVGAAFRTYAGGEESLWMSGSNRVCKYRTTGEALDLIDCAKVPGFEASETTDADVRALVETLDAAGSDESKWLEPLRAYNDAHDVTGTSLAYGVYTLMDREGNYYSGWGTTIYRFADERANDPDSPVKITGSLDIKTKLPPEAAKTISRLMGITMTYDGHIVVAMPGIVALLDRDLDKMEYVLFEGEAIDNGVTVDDKGGIYVVTSKAMRKLVWNGERLSNDEADGAWSSPYDSVPNPRAFSRGAGNTPTLMGFGPNEDHLVLLADAGDPVKIAAFWRDDIPEDFEQKAGARSRRIADQLAFTIDLPATVEWSPHTYGYGAMMFASAWPDPIQRDGVLDIYATIFAAGSSRAAPTGAERFEWNPTTRRLTSVWTQQVPMQWALHPVSSANGVVQLCKFDKGIYSLVAVDWASGKQVGETVLGSSAIFNTMGGFFVPMSNGDVLITGVYGPVRLKNPMTSGAN